MEPKTLVSLRLDTHMIDKADMLAANDDRSRNYIINRLLNEAFRAVERKMGKIRTDSTVLDDFRKKRNRRIAKSSQKGGHTNRKKTTANESDR